MRAALSNHGARLVPKSGSAHFTSSRLYPFVSEHLSTMQIAYNRTTARTKRTKILAIPERSACHLIQFLCLLACACVCLFLWVCFSAVGVSDYLQPGRLCASRRCVRFIILCARRDHLSHLNFKPRSSNKPKGDLCMYKTNWAHTTLLSNMYEN